MKIFDCHGDLYAHFDLAGKKGETNIFQKYHKDNFNKGNVSFGVFNIWVDNNTNIFDLLCYGAKEVLTSNHLKLIKTYDDFDFSSEKVQFIIGLEGIDYLKNPDYIYGLYQYGVRLIGLTWNNSNDFAAGCMDKNNSGLTTKGYEAVNIMNDLGIIIDLSHLSDKSTEDVLNFSKKPVIASHSNARQLCNHVRNLSDEHIKKIANKGGVIGINSYPFFISKNNPTIENLIDHIIYIKKLVGIDFISFGFDFLDYIYDDSYTDFLPQLKNHKDLVFFMEKLNSHGFTENEIEKIAFGNIMRVIKDVL